MKTRQTISAFVVCCNEENNIERALKSLVWCDEIIVVDSGSKDKTVELAKNYTQNIVYNPWGGYCAQKKFALDLCKSDWILNIDADEEISESLRDKILHKLSDMEGSDINGFEVMRLVYFLDMWWDKGGWYPEYRLRLGRRTFMSWGGTDPHEKAIIVGKTEKIAEPIYHYSFNSFTELVDTMNRFSLIAARSFIAEGRKLYPWNFIINPITRFTKFYITRLGFRHGISGLAVAIIEAFYTYLKYLKIWELEKNNKK